MQEQAKKLVEALGLKVIQAKDHLELVYKQGNQGVFAYGNTEDEVIKNFYCLYQELNDD